MLSFCSKEGIFLLFIQKTREKLNGKTRVQERKKYSAASAGKKCRSRSQQK
jgi:hypothetical protein